MEVVLTVIGSIVVGLFGGIGLERYRNARKDLEHRQGYYHRLLAAADAYADAVSEGYLPDMQGSQMALIKERQGIEVFGAKGVAEASRALERAIDGDDDAQAVEVARERMLKAMRQDVGPRRFPFGRRS